MESAKPKSCRRTNLEARALARWFHERTRGASKVQKKKMVVALARKLLVAMWRWVDAGVVIEGAVLKDAKAN